MDRRTTSDPPHPDFLGYQIGRDGDASGWILNPRLAFLAKSTRGRSSFITPESLEEGMLTLIERALSEDRVLLHFSSHEVDMLHRFLSDETFVACAPLLADGKALMTEALRKRGRGKSSAGEATLSAMGLKLCPGVTRTQAEVQVGQTLKDLAASAEKSQRVKRVPPKRMQRWLDLLEYNALDLKILIRGCEKATKKLAHRAEKKTPSTGQNRKDTM